MATMAYCRDGEMSFRQAISAASFTEIEAFNLVSKGRGLYVPKLQVGKTYLSGIQTAFDVTATVSQNEIRLGRLLVPGSAIIDRFRFENTSANVSSLTPVLLYSANDFGFPSALTFDSGDIVTSAAGMKTVSGLSIAVVRGIYWIGLKARGNGCTYNSYSQFGVPEYFFTHRDDIVLASSTPAMAYNNGDVAAPNPFPAEGPTAADSSIASFAMKVEVRYSAVG